MGLKNIIIIIALLVSEGLGQKTLIGYDCDDKKTEITTISLEQISPCPTINVPGTHTALQPAQIIQTRYGNMIYYRSCLVYESTSIKHCGMYSHMSDRMVPTVMQPYPISSRECLEMHTLKTPTGIAGAPNYDLRLNTTVYVSSVLEGTLSSDGSCSSGNSYSYGGITYDNALVLRNYRIKISDGYALSTMSTGQVLLPEGLKCSLSDNTCYDDETGRHIWSTPSERCQHSTFDVLYTGQVEIYNAQKNSSELSQGALVRVSKNQFSLYGHVADPVDVCNRQCFNLEYPGLRICPGHYFDITSQPIGGYNVDLTRYVDSKIASLGLTMQDSLSTVFRALSTSICERERAELVTKLEVIKLSPMSGGLLALNKKGFFGRRAGEVVHLIACPAVEVQLRYNHQCTMEIPVTHKSAEYFLTPHTRVLVRESTPVSCSMITPPTFYIRGEWVSMTPDWKVERAPHILAPMETSPLNFQSIRTFSMGGIYSEKSLADMKSFFIEQHRRDAILTDIARGVSGLGSTTKYDIANVMSTKSMAHIARENLKQVWGVFVGIGQVVTGLVGIVFIVMCIKLVLSMLIRGIISYKEGQKLGYACLSAIGASCYLIAHYFLHRQQGQRESTNSNSLELEETTPRAPIVEQEPLVFTRIYPEP